MIKLVIWTKWWQARRALQQRREYHHSHGVAEGQMSNSISSSQDLSLLIHYIISIGVLKVCSAESSTNIANLANRFFTKLLLPTAWKSGSVTPLLKKPGHNMGNYKNCWNVTNLRRCLRSWNGWLWYVSSCISHLWKTIISWQSAYRAGSFVLRHRIESSSSPTSSLTECITVGCSARWCLRAALRQLNVSSTVSVSTIINMLTTLSCYCYFVLYQFT